jgi:hypothetical protein
MTFRERRRVVGERPLRLSEGSAVLLSRHGASLASKPESFGSGRTFIDMTARPSLDTQPTSHVTA